MLRRNQIFPIVLIVLMVIGILANLRQFLIPAVLVAIVAFLYFFPPNRWRYLLSRMNSRRYDSSHQTSKHHAPDKKKRNAKFRVIQGNKSDDSNDPPQYH